MNTVGELVVELRRRLDSRGAASFFVNGGPGTGKSHALTALSTELPKVIRGSFIVGPKVPRQNDVHDLVRAQMLKCRGAGYLETLPPSEVCGSLNQAWCWLSSNGLQTPNTVFIVLIDLEESALDLASLATLFSSARYLETAWPGNGRLLCVITGRWDVPLLSKYYHQISTSFPYTEGHNYVVWDSISKDEAVQLLPQASTPDTRTLYADILYELTGGNPAVMHEILATLPNGVLSLPAMLKAIAVVAQSGQMAERYLCLWDQLLPESQRLIYRLLISRVVRRPGAQPEAEQLLTLGVVREETIGDVRYLVFRSWYHEMLFRKHLDRLGFADTTAARAQITELMPALQIINREAYRIILDVENAVRNHFALQAQMQGERDVPLLRGRLERSEKKAQRKTDAQERAEKWRSRNARDGLPTDLSPIIAFISTPVLADLVSTLTSSSGENAWLGIGDTLRDLVPVRNAVMHNQLIDEAALLRLYQLRAEVYEALADTEA